jgi:hypothetical protein
VESGLLRRALHTLLRIDKYDNIWRVEEASGLIVKFDPDTVKMGAGRKLG